MSDSPEYDALPERLRRKVTAPAHAGDCWIWTGSIRQAAPRQRSLGPMPEPKANGARPRGRPRTASTYTANERAAPQVHSPQKGYPVPACREVYSISKGVPYDELPRLTRCRNPLCVNPAHAHPTSRPVPRTGRRIHLGPPRNATQAAPSTSSWTDDQILAALKRARPYAGLDPSTAAEEAGCPVPSAEVWSTYQAWDEATPDAEP